MVLTSLGLSAIELLSGDGGAIDSAGECKPTSAPIKTAAADDDAIGAAAVAPKYANADDCWGALPALLRCRC